MEEEHVTTNCLGVTQSPLVLQPLLKRKPTNHATSLQFMQSLLKSRTLSTGCPKKMYK